MTFVKEAYTKLADLCHKKGWHLFYIRPKLHMVSEEGFLGYDAVCAHNNLIYGALRSKRSLYEIV